MQAAGRRIETASEGRFRQVVRPPLRDQDSSVSSEGGPPGARRRRSGAGAEAAAHEQQRGFRRNSRRSRRFEGFLESRLLV